MLPEIQNCGKAYDPKKNKYGNWNDSVKIK
jgi:hypothetical protein